MQSDIKHFNPFRNSVFQQFDKQKILQPFRRKMTFCNAGLILSRKRSWNKRVLFSLRTWVASKTYPWVMVAIHRAAC